MITMIWLFVLITSLVVLVFIMKHKRKLETSFIEAKRLSKETKLEIWNLFVMFFGNDCKFEF